jgi:hypothetical protein
MGKSTSETMLRAAQVTLQNGYSHFRLEGVEMGQGATIAGYYSTGSATAVGGLGFATVQGSAVDIPLRRHTEHVGVTVIMFHADEPGAAGAFDAQEVLKKYGGSS